MKRTNKIIFGAIILILAMNPLAYVMARQEQEDYVWDPNTEEISREVNLGVDGNDTLDLGILVIRADSLDDARILIPDTEPVSVDAYTESVNVTITADQSTIDKGFLIFAFQGNMTENVTSSSGIQLSGDSTWYYSYYWYIWIEPEVLSAVFWNFMIITIIVWSFVSTVIVGVLLLCFAAINKNPKNVRTVTNLFLA
jgi:hypothetical protein